MTIYYVRFAGALPGGEVWNSGVHLLGAGDVDSVAAVGADMAGALWSVSGTAPIGSYYPSGVTLTSVVVYQLNESNGKAIARSEVSTTHVGTSLAITLPQEVAVCCTLRTALPGPSGRGRMYLPGPVVTTVTALGRLSSTVCDDFANAVADALGIAVSNSLTPVLFSIGRGDRIILRVDVGDVFDAQRRRRDKLVEVRHVVDV